MYRSKAQMAVPVRPLPELQWTIITFSGSAVKVEQFKHDIKIPTFKPVVALFDDLI